jgi:transposase
VNLICAVTFMAAVGEIRRVPSTRKLAAYLGLDPKVSQSGSGPATHGRVSKQGSIAGRHALVEASWSAVRQPGPLHAYYERIRARRGHQVAIVPARESSPACSGACSPERRTAPSRSPR